MIDEIRYSIDKTYSICLYQSTFMFNDNKKNLYLKETTEKLVTKKTDAQELTPWEKYLKKKKEKKKDKKKKKKEEVCYKYVSLCNSC